MKKRLSLILACTFIFLLPVQAQARLIEASPRFPSASPDERADVSEGIYAGDERLTFSECLMFDGRMSVMLPDSFTDMPEEMAAWKFPSGDYAQVVKSDSDGGVCFAFRYIEDEPLKANDVAKKIKAMQRERQFIYSNDYFDNGKVEKLGIELGWFGFKNPTSDLEYFYNLQIIMSVDGKAMYGAFICPFADRAKWIPVFQAVLPTIKEREVK